MSSGLSSHSDQSNKRPVVLGILLLQQCVETVERRDAAPGDTVTLGCNVSYHIETTWIKQPSGESPSFALTAFIRNDGDLFVKNQLSPRFRAVILERSIQLSIVNVTPADCGLYYCVGKTSLNLQLGGGISLTVSVPGTTMKPPEEDSEPGTAVPRVTSSQGITKKPPKQDSEPVEKDPFGCLSFSIICTMLWGSGMLCGVTTATLFVLLKATRKCCT
ncbi:hypothetical protein GN956_G12433 [Arapaima gigas]